MLTLLILWTTVESASSSCIYGGTLRAKDEVWVNGMFKYRCESDGGNFNVKISCLTPNGDEVENGTNRTIGDMIYICGSVAGGALVGLTQEPLEHASCGDHKYGEEFMFGDQFKVKCAAYGVIELLGCVVEGEFHRVGTTFKGPDGHDVECVIFENEFKLAPKKNQ
ncbi:hypothetical protein GCK32_011611 [Trichostrongylus colubriformis]|uniref:Abnormal cell migration protein 18-like fibronectin type I domain-containing protein n=1 Tax=Trichostrongylus colubriformis TaxID=6319 RepID=A0AAN8FAF1_TRICO